MSYAHPMGWARAALLGTLYGLVLGGLPWMIWRAVALESPPWRADVCFAYLFMLGLFIILAMEKYERKLARDGALNLGRPL